MKLATSLLTTLAASEGGFGPLDYVGALLAKAKRCPWEEMLEIKCMPSHFAIDFNDNYFDSYYDIAERNPLCVRGWENDRVSEVA